MDVLMKPPPRWMGSGPWKHFTTFARSLLAGGAATLADLAVIAFATGILHVSARTANVPALLVGATVQFFGNRHFAFRAASGRIQRQALLFIATETVAMILNAALYYVVARGPLSPLMAVLLRACTTNLVFLCWSYPVWKRIFQPSNGYTAER